MTIRAQANKEIKRQRVPVGGQRTRLQLSKEDRDEFTRRKMVPYWFNDVNGQVEAAQAGGYTFVHPKHAISLGGYNVDGDVDLEAKVSRIVDREGLRAYLMEISQKFYNEDQKAKHDVTMQVDYALQAVSEGGQTIEGGYTPK